MSVDMMERAVEWVNMSSIYNDDCKAGCEAKLAELKAEGIEIPDELPIESHSLPSPAIQYKSDLELFGPGDDVPMTGRLAPGYNPKAGGENLADGMGSMHIGRDDEGDLSSRQVQIAGEYHDIVSLRDITNARDARSAIPFGGPYSLEQASSSSDPKSNENAAPTILERRARKRAGE